MLRIGNLGAGSDQAALIGKIGIPCFDIGFSMNYSYPSYHSAYDSFKFSLIIDQDFVVGTDNCCEHVMRVHVLVGQDVSELVFLFGFLCIS